MFVLFQMYSIRPCTTENVELDLPTSMYPVRPVIEQTKKTNESAALKEIEQRQDILLEKLENLIHQISLYEQRESTNSLLKTVKEEFVVHLSAKQPSKNILNLIEQFRKKLSIRTFHHSSLHDNSFKNPLQISSLGDRKISVIWADGTDLPYMFHGQKKINDEQSIVNLLSQQLTVSD